MKKTPVYIVRVYARDLERGGDHVGVGHYLRVPTVDEFIEGMFESFRENEELAPGFTTAILRVVSRTGIPSLPNGRGGVGAEYGYADGRVTVDRGSLYELPDEEKS